MLINDHILIAAWIGAWTKSRVGPFDKALETKALGTKALETKALEMKALGTNYGTDYSEAQTTRNRANNFAQLRRLGHHRYRLWERQLQVRRRGVVSVVSVCGPVESAETPGLDGFGDGDGSVRKDRIEPRDVEEREASNDSERDEVGSALVGEPGSLQKEAGEDQHGPPQVADATSDKVEFQVEGHQYELPQIHNLELSSTPQLARIQVFETASKHYLLPVSEPSAVQSQGEKRQDEPPRHSDASKPVQPSKVQPSKAHEIIKNPEQKNTSGRDVDYSRRHVLEFEACYDGGKYDLTLQATPAPSLVRLDLLENAQTSLGAVKVQETQPKVQQASQNCGHRQCRASIGAGKRTKESRLNEAAFTSDTSRQNSRLASILATAKLTDGLTVSAWLPCKTPGAGGAQLSNVAFRKCEGSGLRLMPECEVVNVEFINCIFDRTTFLDVTFSNVTFSHVDFTGTTFHCLVLRNVTVTKLKFRLRDAIWRATYLENALVSRHNFGLPLSDGGCSDEHCLWTVAASSKTRRFAISGALSADDLSQAVGHDGASDQNVHLCFKPLETDILTRLAKHEAIFDRIMGFCFPSSSVYIYEYPYQWKIPHETTLRQGSYSRRGHRTMTTYFGSLQEGLLVKDKRSESIPRRGIGNCTGLIRVNERLGRLAYKHLYSRDFHLQCSAEGAMRFLLAHKRGITWMKQLVLYYHWADDQLGFATDMPAWRLLLCKIRHELAYIENIRLHMGKSLWKFNKPALGVNRVLDDPRLCPLSEVHKFAAPADRWRFKGDNSTHRTDGTDLQIHIEGAGTQEEVDFVGDLVAEIEERRVGRPLFVTLSKGEEIKYKCAEDFR